MAHRTCTLDGCGRKHRARGLCSSHYNQTHGADRHRKELVECSACGEPVMKVRSRNKSIRPVCSDRCKYFVQWGYWPKGRDLVGPVAAAVERSVVAPMVVIPSTRLVFVAGECAWCEAAFTTRTTSGVARTCSADCQRLHERRSGGRRFIVRPQVRLSIYERDGWICQLCGDPVDADLDPNDIWGATLDHVVPQSRGGSDHPANLQLAHRWCNSVINDRSSFDAGFLLAG